MDKGLIILAVGLLVGLLVGALVILDVPGPAEQPMADAPADTWGLRSSGSTGMGAVSVDLRPQGYSDGRLVIDASINTHTVSLSAHDLSEQAYLVVDGERFSPVEAPAMQGHHVSGAFVFALPEEPESFSLIIEGLPAVDVREHAWP